MGFLTIRMKNDVDVVALKVMNKVTPRGTVRSEVPQKMDCGIVPDTRKTTLGVYDYEIPRGDEICYPESGYPNGESRVGTNMKS